jgi:predicted CXXCH cytochrome family protein
VTRRTSLVALALGASALALGLGAWLARPWWRAGEGPPLASTPAAHVGGRTCAGCHREQYALWTTSDHARAMQPATAATVLGNFAGATFRKDGVTTAFFTRDGAYFVRTDGPDGALHDYRIAYTFGVEPLQQYLIEFPRGRYQALGVAWDSRPAAAGGQRWFHLHPGERIHHGDVLHWTGLLQNWNYMCADCHSTNLQKNYRLAEDRFDTTWTDVNVSCEACHGPGGRHVQWAQAGAAAPDARRGSGPAAPPDPLRGFAVSLADPGRRWALAPGEGIARRAAPPRSGAQVEACGRCHARRAPVGGDVAPGEPLEQGYRVSLLESPRYHADGQIRDEVYEYGSFLQSRMYRAGVTCSDCHDPHSARLRQQGNAVCAQCHLPARYDTPRHAFHPAGSEGARCVSCHMPLRHYMVVDGRRDHSFRAPRPDLSQRIGTPNACTDCHTNRSAAWAAEAVARWYGPGRRAGWHYADALHAGQTGRADAEGQLLRAVQDAAVPPIARATALSLLPRYAGPASALAVEAALKDGDPLVRRAAAGALSAVEPRRRVALGAPLLADPVRGVRFEALSTLLDVPRGEFTREQLAALDAATAEYRRAQAASADRPEAHVNLGALDARLGHLDSAELGYRTALRLQPTLLPAYINLADLYRQRGQEDRVVGTLEAAIKADPTSGDAHEGLGLSLVRQKRLREALPMLARAAELRPDVPRYAYVYGVALHEAGEPRRALDVLRGAHARAPADREILTALAQYARAAGDRRAAEAWARKLVEVAPDDAGARQLLKAFEAAP